MAKNIDASSVGKRPRTTEPATAPQSNKRVTRSSTRTDAPASQALTECSTTRAKASKKTSTANKVTNKLKKTNSAPATVPNDQDTFQSTPSTSPNNVTTLHITSPLAKSPIECHSYSAPSTSPTIVFTHGAGGTLSAPAMLNFCTGISTHFSILAFQGSMNLGSRVKGFHACIEHLGAQKRLILGGRSMGARAAVMAASEVLEEEEARQVELVLASYPLQGPKDVRDQILLDLPTSVRVVFVSGDRDAMCPLEMLEGVRKRMKARSQVVVVRGADHGMHVKPARLEREVGERTGRVVADWLAGDVENDVTYIEVEE